ncbi:hypothetical protein L228DRAFT_99800 [Xylona heveae TC161]|uniref:Large ribosomal subunit protein bL34m n=1 Tax=Xylona heveae (strain CBS 132557 / TC161) TaxID=1328760 RepID=A0A161TQH7_XYLHT|nr:hypothetical protein L228DRAFT_99800 [Xylona heveae TC161]KZF24586.1 hypothetical protein L228DRAFT_99800 [Xylona heveae TC161]
MLCVRCLRGSAVGALSRGVSASARPATSIGAGNATKRSLTIPTLFRPRLSYPRASPSISTAVSAGPAGTASEATSSSSITNAASAATGIFSAGIPKPSTHPAMAGTQLRTVVRNTFRPSHRVRKRRHGFLARRRSRTGRQTLTRRRAKGRGDLSH